MARTYQTTLDAGRSRVSRKTTQSSMGPSVTVKDTGMDGMRGDLLRLYVSPDGSWEIHARDSLWRMVLVASGDLPQ